LTYTAAPFSAPFSALLPEMMLTMSDTKSGIVGREKQIAWSNEYLERLLFQSRLASDSE
jgi:hypothetical protein